MRDEGKFGRWPLNTKAAAANNADIIAVWMRWNFTMLIQVKKILQFPARDIPVAGKS